MKHLNEYIKESLLDVDDMDANLDDVVKREEVWNDLTKKYGIILDGADSGKISSENIDFDKKGRIVFKNWPGPGITFNFSGVIPECIEKYGLGDLPPEIENIDINGFQGKLSKLRLEGNYKNINLYFDRGSIELDIFPKFQAIAFNDVFVRNSHIIPKRKPKNCMLRFDESTITHIFASWSDRMFGEYPRWIRGGQEVDL